MVFKDVVTIFHKEKENYEKIIVKNVFVYSTVESQVGEQGLNVFKSTHIHIPKTSVPNGLPELTSSDFIVPEEIELTIDNTNQKTQSQSLKAIREQNDIITVVAFSKNFYGTERMKHYEVTCK